MSQQVIICVDDEVIVLDALREQIQQEFGDELLVEVAESGHEALEIYNEVKEDGMEIPIIIADFIMPDMKGDALLERTHGIFPETKKIMLTGQASLEGVSNAINKADLYRYISKPWEKDDLMLTIREALKSYNQSATILTQNEELKELNNSLEVKVDERTKELQEANATKDKFFSIIAHDLKNPFNTLMGFSELLLDNFKEYKPEQVKQYVGIIHDTAKNSYSLLENLLNWSRSQTGNLKMEALDIDVSQLTKDTVGLLLNQAEQKNIIIENKLDADILAHADSNMVQTVIRNLISNSIKFTNAGGAITIEHQSEDGHEVFCISDTGVGMKPEKLDELFKINKNSSTQGTANEMGTGLGLILCKEFIEKNKGEIWVESEENIGSKFYFSLPVARG